MLAIADCTKANVAARSASHALSASALPHFLRVQLYPHGPRGVPLRTVAPRAKVMTSTVVQDQQQLALFIMTPKLWMMMGGFVFSFHVFGSSVCPVRYVPVDLVILP